MCDRVRGISKLLRAMAFTWRPRELSRRIKSALFWGNLLSEPLLYYKKYYFNVGVMFMIEFLER